MCGPMGACDPRKKTMAIDKAIEILTLAYKNAIASQNKDWGDAVSLGIEALKRIKKGRASLKWPFCDRPLPGETQD